MRGTPRAAACGQAPAQQGTGAATCRAIPAPDAIASCQTRPIAGPPPTLTLDLLTDRYAIARLPSSEPAPRWALAAGHLAAVVRRGEELSVVCRQDVVPEQVSAQRNYAALVVRGPLDFELTGILAALAAPLAESGVPIFAISTYDTDVLLVPHAQLTRARAALTEAGHAVVDPPAVSRLS